MKDPPNNAKLKQTTHLLIELRASPLRIVLNATKLRRTDTGLDRHTLTRFMNPRGPLRPLCGVPAGWANVPSVMVRDSCLLPVIESDRRWPAGSASSMTETDVDVLSFLNPRDARSGRGGSCSKIISQQINYLHFRIFAF